MILVFIIIWVLHTLFWVPLMIIGWILIPLATAFKAYENRKSKFIDKEILCWTWWIMYPWGNEEDGIVAGEEFVNSPDWIRIIYWSAFRNPVNNLRYIRPFNCYADPKKIKFKASEYIMMSAHNDDVNQSLWYLCWQGVHANYRVQFYIGNNLYRFWIGWKLYPSTTLSGVPEYQKNGVGFAYQVKKIARKI